MNKKNTGDTGTTDNKITNVSASDKISLRVRHGMYGYIAGHRRLVIIITAVYFILALGLFYIGIYLTHSKKNYLTIIAVLALLPACKSLVNVVMFIKAKGCSHQLYMKIKDHTGSLINFYDMYFTSEHDDFPICHICVCGNTIVGITEYERVDCNLCEKHLKTILAKDGYKDLTIKIFTDPAKYTARLDQLNSVSGEGSEHSRLENGIAATLISISLS